MSIQSRSILSLLDKEYRIYSEYVIKDRAIPSLVDGLKPSTRKVLYTAIKKCRQKVKTISLVGAVVDVANYHHGDGSLGGAIATLTAPWANNIPILEGEGSWGDRFDHTPAQPRYTSIQLSNAFDKYFKDNDILEADIDPENREPLFYLPIIPWILVNGSSGIAVGFANEIQPRKPEDLIKAVAKILNGQKIKASDVPPWYASFKGKIEFNKELDRYQMIGIFKELSATEIQITEIPIKYNRAEYVSLLDKLEDDGKISFYRDRSDKNGFNFLIKFPRGKMPKTHDQIRKMFGLIQNLNENLTLIDQNNKLRVFKDVVELIEAFVEYRFKRVHDRLKNMIGKTENNIKRMKETLRFIVCVLEGKIDPKKNKKELIEQLKKASFDEDQHERLISLPIYSLCKDKIDELTDQILTEETKRSKLLTTNPKEMYLNDLKEI